MLKTIVASVLAVWSASAFSQVSDSLFYLQAETNFYSPANGFNGNPDQSSQAYSGQDVISGAVGSNTLSSYAISQGGTKPSPYLSSEVNVKGNGYEFDAAKNAYQAYNSTASTNSNYAYSFKINTPDNAVKDYIPVGFNGVASFAYARSSNNASNVSDHDLGNASARLNLTGEVRNSADGAIYTNPTVFSESLKLSTSASPAALASIRGFYLDSTFNELIDTKGEDVNFARDFEKTIGFSQTYYLKTNTEYKISANSVVTAGAGGLANLMIRTYLDPVITLNQTNLNAGYTLEVASGVGNLMASPVPEISEVQMLTAGMLLIGLVAYRKRAKISSFMPVSGRMA